MWLPAKVYESLPMLYIMIGTLLLSGALYIGVRSELMLGYAVLGTSCVLAGVFITYIRHKARSPERSPEIGTDQVSA